MSKQPGWPAVLLFAAYLLVAPPVFLLGPLVGLLLLSRPGTLREWAWLAGLAAWSAVWLQHSGGLGSQVARAGSVLLTGAFLALTLWRPSWRFSRALIATGIAGAALAGWMWHLGIGWTQLRNAVGIELAPYQRALRTQWAGMGTSRQLVDQMSATMDTVSTLYPALLTLAGIAGLRLAWAWYHRISARPLGAPPAPFRAFGFSDQLVWGWVVGLALYLQPVSPVWQTAGTNLMLVWAVLYAVRGLAVFAAGSARVPGPVMAVLTLIAMFLLPFVLGGLTLLGLADTWLDFRRRLATPATGG
jgi:Predicted membrane protein (DUF2232)